METILYRVKVDPKVEPVFVYDQVADNWMVTETDNEYLVQVIDPTGFESLADEDPFIIEYRAR